MTWGGLVGLEGQRKRSGKWYERESEDQGTEEQSKTWCYKEDIEGDEMKRKKVFRWGGGKVCGKSKKAEKVLWGSVSAPGE